MMVLALECLFWNRCDPLWSHTLHPSYVQRLWQTCKYSWRNLPHLIRLTFALLGADLFNDLFQTSQDLGQLGTDDLSLGDLGGGASDVISDVIIDVTGSAVQLYTLHDVVKEEGGGGGALTCDVTGGHDVTAGHVRAGGGDGEGGGEGEGEVVVAVTAGLSVEEEI